MSYRTSRRSHKTMALGEPSSDLSDMTTYTLESQFVLSLYWRCNCSAVGRSPGMSNPMEAESTVRPNGAPRLRVRSSHAAPSSARMGPVRQGAPGARFQSLPHGPRAHCRRRAKGHGTQARGTRERHARELYARLWLSRSP